MNSVILYDSWYGNTEQIARAMADGIGHGVQRCKVAYATHLELDDIDLLLIGAPTHGGVASPAMNEYLQGLPAGALNGVRVATFDTRVGLSWIRFLGYASRRLARTAERKGAVLVAEPMGFYVRGKEGPLRAGEAERAKAWAKELATLAVPAM